MRQRTQTYKKYMIIQIGKIKSQCIIADDKYAVFGRFDEDNGNGDYGIDMTDVFIRPQNAPGLRVKIISDGIGVKGLYTIEKGMEAES